MRVFAVTTYDSPVGHLVRAKQWRLIGAAYALGLLVANHIKEHATYDYLIPVPLHASRYAWRGYNQAHVMSEALSEQTGIAIGAFFKRVKRTRFQAGLSHDDRKHNLKQVFGPSLFFTTHDLKKMLSGKRVLLIDDVYTTGATLQSFASFIRIFRPACIDAAVACRVVLDHK